MRRTLAASVAAVAICAHAQTPDSIPAPRPLTPLTATSLGQGAIVAVPLLGGSLAVKSADDRFRQHHDGPLPARHRHEYYLQYAPAATLLGMKCAGIEGESTWTQMLTADIASVALMGAAVELLKHTADVPRPDGSDDHSYPSGHTATAFMTATMLHHEYGSRYPWLSVLGYGTATATGYLRIAANRHNLSDVMAGAGIGIMATELGYLVSDLIFRKPLLRHDIGEGWRECRPTHIGYDVRIGVPLGSTDLGDGTVITPSAACTIAVNGAWFAGKHLGIGGEASYSSSRFYTDTNTAQDAQMHHFGAMAGAYASLPLSRLLRLGARTLAGCTHYTPTDITSGGRAYTLAARTGFAWSAGVSLSMLAQRSLSYSLVCDYTCNPAPASGGEKMHSLTVGCRMALDIR